MEIRDLRALKTVAECGSFSAAAQRLGYTQSAISQQIAAMEAELGRRLLTRRPVQPTEAGARLIEHADHILLRLTVARAELEGIGNRRSTFSLSVSPLSAPEAVTSAVRYLQHFDPIVPVRVDSAGSAAAAEMVAAGAVDAAFVDGLAAPGEALHPADAGLFAASYVVERPVVVAVASSHPLAGRTSIDLETLVDAPWVSAPGLVDEAALTRFGITGIGRRAATYRGTEVGTLVAMVAAGAGAALLPAQRLIESSGVACVPLSEPVLTHRTELLTLRTPGPTTAAVIWALRGVRIAD